jgi:hypothetical protein
MTMRIHGDKIEFPDGTEQFTASSGTGTATPPVAFNLAMTTDFDVASNVETVVPFNNAVIDTDNARSGNKYVVKKAGLYDLSYSAGLGRTDDIVWASTYLQLNGDYITVDNLNFDYNTKVTRTTHSNSKVVQLEVGDEISVSVKGLTTNPTFKCYANNTYLSGHMISGSGGGSDTTRKVTVIDTAIGMVAPFAMGSVPTGWLHCNGSAVSRDTYSLLYSKVGDTYGAGNGSTTFNLPNLQDEFIRGSSGTLAVGSKQADAFKSHSHTGSTSHKTLTGSINQQGNRASINGGTGVFSGSGSTSYGKEDIGGAIPSTISLDASHSHTFTTAVTGGTETRPRNVAMMYCINATSEPSTGGGDIDYEEGEYDADLTIGGVVNATAKAIYSRIGNQVTVNVRNLSVTGKTGTGQLIVGLPFVANDNHSTGVARFSGFTNLGESATVAPFVVNGQNIVAFQASKADGYVLDKLYDQHCNDNFTIYSIDISYQTSGFSSSGSGGSGGDSIWTDVNGDAVLETDGKKLTIDANVAELGAKARITTDTNSLEFNVGAGSLPKMSVGSDGKVDIEGVLEAKTNAYFGNTSSASVVNMNTVANWNYSGLNVIRHSSNNGQPRLIGMPLGGDPLNSTVIGEYNAIWGMYNSTPTSGSTSASLKGELVYGAHSGHKWYNNGSKVMSIASDGRVDITGSLYVNGTPKSLDAMVTDLEKDVKLKDKLIEKLSARLDKLEKKLK